VDRCGVVVGRSGVVVGRCGSLWVVVGSLWGRSGSLWIVVGSLWVVVGSLWVVVDRCGVIVGRCGSLWIVVGSLWVVPCFSNYAQTWQKFPHAIQKYFPLPIFSFSHLSSVPALAHEIVCLSISGIAKWLQFT
jgi:hypothetical protein